MNEIQHNADDAAAAAAIEATCVGRWRAWRSDTGRWWAARTGPLTSADLAAGRRPFLSSGTADGLAGLIRDEERRQATDPALDQKDPL